MECKFAKYCGGCNLIHLPYNKQLDVKQEYIEDLLGKLHSVERIIPCTNTLNYRNKVQVAFGNDERGRVICGNYVVSTHFIVPVSDCLINDKKSNEIIASIKELVNKYHISIFDERVYKGCLRHVQIRCTKTGEYMVILITGSSTIYKKDLLIRDLVSKHPYFKTIIHNINNKHTSMVLGEKSYVIYGSGYIQDSLCGLRFNLSASSFYQINKYQTETLYNKALDLAKLDKNYIAIDAYSGIGTISLCLAQRVKDVTGVEINSRAVIDARRNAKLNNIENVNFICDDAGAYMEKLSKNKKAKVDVLCMDPPRAGASDKFLKSVLILLPKKIIYISCGPESLK